VDSQPVIELRNLTKFYGKSRGVLGVDLTVRQGEIYGFLGPNGAGKSTTINMLLDIIRPTTGEIMVFGQPNTGNTAEIRRRIAYLAGDMELYSTLTGWQYIQLVGEISGDWSKKRAHELADQLEANVTKKIHSLSRGNRQKIGLIAALARNTKLLILDEPTSGLDPLIQKQFRDLMHDYQKDGGTVFISSHVLSEVQTLCDRVAFIREGKIIDAGTLTELLSNVPKRVIVKAPKEILDKIARAHKVKRSDGHVQFDIHGSAGPILAKLPLEKIDDITVAPPELEEIFMSFYEGGVQ
jgi:ABC-2 type transport system ATP-binding protein